MWYNCFSIFYDRFLEKPYAPYRSAAIEKLNLPSGSRVLDLPCGTGQSFTGLAPFIGDGGRLIAVDYSKGMLGKATKRVARSNIKNVFLERASIQEVNSQWLASVSGDRELDGVFCSLGLTALPDWEESFNRLFSLLREGGRFVLMDAYSESSTWSSRSVGLIARANLSRKTWIPLADQCSDFSREILSTNRSKFGGELYVASGTKLVAGQGGAPKTRNRYKSYSAAPHKE